MQEVHVEHRFDHSCESVFRALSDHEQLFPAPGFRCRLLQHGTTDRNGSGALREVRSGRLRLVEQIGHFESPLGYDYCVESLQWRGIPLPFRHQRGWLELHPEKGGCRAVWRSRFSVPLGFIGRRLERQIASGASSAFARVLRAAGRRLDAAAH